MFASGPEKIPTRHNLARVKKRRHFYRVIQMSISSRGIYLLANDSVLDLAIACMSSLRTHNPEIDLCIVPFDSSIRKLQNYSDRFKFCIWNNDHILRDCDQISLKFHDSVMGHYRKLAMWSGPFEEFLYIDVDTVVLENIEFVYRYLADYDFLASHSNMPSIRRFVWKPNMPEVPGLNEEMSSYAANTGFIASRKGLLAINSLSEKLSSAVGLIPFMELESYEQPLLNYLIVTSGLRFGSLWTILREHPEEDIPVERWGGADIQGIDSGQVEPRDGVRTLLVHWAGEWRRARQEGRPIANEALWRFYREKE